jgi:hypothetical protein
MTSDPTWAEVVTLFGVLESDLASIVEALSTARFIYRNELELHDGIVARLASVGVEVTAGEREVRLDAAGRIDFLLRSGLGIEVKVKGQAGDVWRQLDRYARHDRVRRLLLVTTRARHMAGPTGLHGKPVAALLLRGGLQ